MVTKTTSVSGFHFIFVFYDLDLVENEYNIEGSYLKNGTYRDTWFSKNIGLNYVLSSRNLTRR